MSDIEASSVAMDAGAPGTGVPEGEAIHDWPLRPWILAALLAVAGLVIHLATDGYNDEPFAMAVAAFAFFGSLTLAFTLDRNRYIAPGIFAGIVAVAMFGLAWRVASADSYAADEAFWFAAGVVAVLLAIPLFQAGFVRDRMTTSYRATHFFVWTDAITAAGALAFLGISWALLAILSELFQLLQIDLLKDLMNEGWFGWMFSGAAFGAAFGVLRNQIKILGTLQNVVMLVLSILAIPLAAALLLFLAAMIISGPEVLWNATDSATPILLACAVGAFVLTNAVIRDSDAETLGNRVTRIAALVLALAIFPLAVFAAISMGTRIGQHGLSPERIWGLIAIVVAVIYGAAYLIGVLRGRKGGAWRERLRQANFHMALLVCVVAVILALPIFDFGATSTRNQLNRLAGGDVSAENFDYSALKWDFGEAGKEALDGLAQSDNATIAQLAKDALAMEQRPYGRTNNAERREIADAAEVVVSDPAAADAVRTFITTEMFECQEGCRAVEVGEVEEGLLVVLLGRNSPDYLVVESETGEAVEYYIQDGRLAPQGAFEYEELDKEADVELRPFNGRQLYVDGKPVGQPFE